MDEQTPQPLPETHELLRQAFIDPPLPEARPWRLKAFFISLIILIVLAFVAYLAFIRPPQNAPKDILVTVEKGETLSGIADILSTKRIIRSRFAFKALLVVLGGSKGLQAGDYYLQSPENAAQLAFRLSHSLYDLKNLKVTIPEGLNVREIAAIFAKEPRFAHFKSDEFIKIASPYEGYLFPDTYLFLTSVTAQDVIDAMLANYKKRIEGLASDITSFGKPIRDVIEMASILEEEARTVDTRETIAGILWKRLASGMPLQVDSSIVYATGKKSGNDLSPDDFKTASPYNTYLYKGLPPTPLSNPGLDAIRAAVHPITSKYVYYLTDAQGGFHPAATYEEHVMNRAKYLGY